MYLEEVNFKIDQLKLINKISYLYGRINGDLC